MVLVRSCLSKGWFLWKAIWPNLFPCVFSLRLKYFEVTRFNKEKNWSHSTPTECSQKWAGDFSNTSFPSCSQTAYWTFKSRLFSLAIPCSCQTTLFLKINLVAFTILGTATKGNRRPLFCLKQVNFAWNRYDRNCMIMKIMTFLS